MADRRRALGLALSVGFRADPWRATAVLVLSSAASLTGVATAFWVKHIVDSAAAADQDAAVAAALGLALTAGAGSLVSAISTRMTFPLKEIVGLYLDRRILSSLAAIPSLQHHERPEYLDRVDVLRREMPTFAYAGMQTAGAVALAVQALATGALLVSVNPLLLAVPLFAVPSWWAGARAEHIRQAALDTTAEQWRRGSHLFELATAPAAGKELRVFGLDDELLQRYRRYWAENDRALDLAARRAIAWSAAGWLLFGAGYGGAIAVMVSQAVSGGASVGDVVLALALLGQINAQVSAAAGVISSFVRNLNVAGRLLWLTDYSAAAQPASDDPAPAPDRLTQGIALRDVAFRYPGTETEVLGGVDLLLPAGATVAVVGDNGAGKSTLVKLLCRFYEPTAGAITIDGTDLSRIPVGEWRQRVSAGFQDFARLELRAGHTVGVGDLPHLDDTSAVSAALERAASTEVVSSLPSGMDTQLGASFEAGMELSGGQWQKLALARAMMRPAPLLLVLDEPTAALDAETEHLLFARYAAMASTVAAGNGAITLLVSHRFSTVRMADLIVVVDGGRVVEAGSHEELVRAAGLYAELYELQARAYR